MTTLRVHAILYPDDLTDPSPLSQDGPKYLKAPLPKCEGKRPKAVSRIMPQRQVPEAINSKAKDRLQSLVRRLGDDHPDLLIVKASKKEGGTTDAIYAKSDL